MSTTTRESANVTLPLKEVRRLLVILVKDACDDCIAQVPIRADGTRDFNHVRIVHTCGK